ncbi:UNVERIFIED_CONTAM: hypothetical protein FKN15_050747 [Acipenser sinensis]
MLACFTAVLYLRASIPALTCLSACFSVGATRKNATVLRLTWVTDAGAQCAYQCPGSSLLRTLPSKLLWIEPSAQMLIRANVSSSLLQSGSWSIMTDLHYLSQTDGAGDWREKEARDLSNLVQNRITYLQDQDYNVCADICCCQWDTW